MKMRKGDCWREGLTALFMKIVNALEVVFRDMGNNCWEAGN
jgi:hypothetical protein